MTKSSRVHHIGLPKLATSRVSSTGLVISHYERDGEVKIGDTASAEPSRAEVARQERMKRDG